MDEVARSGATVPSIWRLEVANALRTGIRLGRLTYLARGALMQGLLEMGIVVDRTTDARVWPDIIDLSDRHGLTTYDAAYLELALRQKLPLASLDKNLCRAARRADIRVVPA